MDTSSDGGRQTENESPSLLVVPKNSFIRQVRCGQNDFSLCGCRCKTLAWDIFGKAIEKENGWPLGVSDKVFEES